MSETPATKKSSLPAGVGVAMTAAILFGVSAPVSKLLLGQVSPLLLAGLLYLGSGIGLSLVRFVLRGRRPAAEREACLQKSQWPWLAGAVVLGGALGPVLLMVGLHQTPASSGSLLLNLEGVFTALLAWFVFQENYDRRIAGGMVAIVLGGLLLSWQPGASAGLSWGALVIVGACLCWGIDNNLTQRVSSSDPYQIAAIKGLVAGTVNMAIALTLGNRLPGMPIVIIALLVGFLGYGLSLACFVIALRYIGTARTGAYFSLAPFVGAAVSLPLFHESITAPLAMAAGLMGLGVWLHLTENHVHLHHHERLEHAHRHVHDEHHQHTHEPGVDTREPHTHRHVHEPVTHSHPHFPDIHHRHSHSSRVVG